MIVYGIFKVAKRLIKYPQFPGFLTNKKGISGDKIPGIPESSAIFINNLHWQVLDKTC